MEKYEDIIMKKTFIIIISSLLLAGCEPIKVDISYSHTNQGYINDGLFKNGDLFLVDTVNNSISRIKTIDVSTYETAPSGKSTLTASNITGFTVSANFNITQTQKDSISANLSKEMTIQLTNFAKTSINSPYDVIANELRTTAVEQLANEWRSDETVDSNTKYYLFVSQNINADSARFYLGDKEAGTGNGLTLNIEGQSLQATIQSRSSNVWQGSGTPVLVTFYPFKLIKRQDGSISSKSMIENEVKNQDIVSLLKSSQP